MKNGTCLSMFVGTTISIQKRREREEKEKKKKRQKKVTVYAAYQDMTIVGVV